MSLFRSLAIKSSPDQNGNLSNHRYEMQRGDKMYVIIDVIIPTVSSINIKRLRKNIVVGKSSASDYFRKIMAKDDVTVCVSYAHTQDDNCRC